MGNGTQAGANWTSRTCVGGNMALQACNGCILAEDVGGLALGGQLLRPPVLDVWLGAEWAGPNATQAGRGTIDSTMMNRESSVWRVSKPFASGMKGMDVEYVFRTADTTEGVLLRPTPLLPGTETEQPLLVAGLLDAFQQPLSGADSQRYGVTCGVQSSYGHDESSRARVLPVDSSRSYAPSNKTGQLQVRPYGV